MPALEKYTDRERIEALEEVVLDMARALSHAFGLAEQVKRKFPALQADVKFCSTIEDFYKHLDSALVRVGAYNGGTDDPARKPRLGGWPENYRPAGWIGD